MATSGALPTGLVAFLFTDLVGSTRLWADAPKAMATDLARHHEIVTGAIARRDGFVFSTGGDGFGAAFHRVSDAVDAAVDAQRDLAAARWGVPGGILVRMGIHAGESVERGRDYFGSNVSTAARLMATAHGGQIVVSASSVGPGQSPGTIDLGDHRLRDVADPVRVLQVVAEGLAVDFPPLRSTGQFTSTLPHHLSSFVGRQAEIDKVRTLLARHRLVTLTGVGGAGKTRLAVEAASAEQDDFAGGVFFVDLATVDDPAAVPAAVVTGIGLVVGDPTTLREELHRFLEPRRVLLVVDNCEHLLDPVADLLDDLLAAAPDLRVIATSREALETEGEETYRVPSLDEASGVRLFVERATAVNDQFELTDSVRETAADLVTHLDGMPLAIELAASRARTLSPAELREGLTDRFALLRAGRRRGAIQRQRTLEAAIDWSHDLLSADEQVFFRRLGAFAGLFAFDVVPAVADFGRARALDLLDSLVAQSLVVMTPIDEEQTAYRLLETVRAYAVGKMAAAGEVDAVADRHEEAYGAGVRDRMFSPRDWDQKSFLRHLRWYLTQIADLWAAAERALSAGRIDRAVEIHLLGWQATMGTGFAAGYLDHMKALDARLADDDLPGGRRTEFLGALAWAHMTAGDFAGSMAAVARGVDAADGVAVEHRFALEMGRIVWNTGFAPEEAIDLVEGLMTDIAAAGASPATVRGTLTTWMAAPLMVLRQHERAYHVVLDVLDEGAETQMLAGFLWAGHLIGADPPDVVDDKALVEDPYAVSDLVGRAMCRQLPQKEIGAELAGIADRWLTGRLAYEESEVLVAYARLAQLRGDDDRVRELLAATITRTPWGMAVIAEIEGSVEGWSDEEWHDRRIARLIERTSDQWLTRARDEGPRVLADEISRWR